MSEELKTLSALRQRHHDSRNRNRRGTPRSLEFRDMCLGSAIGQRVNEAGLFADFFDVLHDDVGPQQMAAKLLLRELERISRTGPGLGWSTDEPADLADTVPEAARETVLTPRHGRHLRSTH